MCILLWLAVCVVCYGQQETALLRILKGQAAVEEAGPYYETMVGTVMCGYQGWFGTPTDGANRGWFHYGRGRRFEPGACTIDLWPDMSEYDADEQFETAFRHADGAAATVFSPYLEKTVVRHFKWMKDYGIDGVFLQRFATEIRPGSSNRKQRDQVMLNCRKGANEYKRAWAMMYDLSGIREGATKQVIEDWKYLVDTFKVGKDPEDRAYLHHKGKPVVAVWGIAFPKRAYTLEECEAFIEFLKNDPVYGGYTVMIGIGSYWREGKSDCVDDPRRFEVFKKADIISPWSVGRYGSKDDRALNRYAADVWVKDKAWCDENGLDYLPVVWPGFSWYNMGNGPLNQVPRQGGAFLWKQYYKAIHDAGATMMYQAMFDEVDEGTAIFKCTNDPPNGGGSQFVTYEGLPSDHYLWLVGQAKRMLNGDIPKSEKMPKRN